MKVGASEKDPMFLSWQCYVSMLLRNMYITIIFSLAKRYISTKNRLIKAKPEFTLSPERTLIPHCPLRQSSVWYRFNALPLVPHKVPHWMLSLLVTYLSNSNT